MSNQNYIIEMLDLKDSNVTIYGFFSFFVNLLSFL